MFVELTNWFVELLKNVRTPSSIAPAFRNKNLIVISGRLLADRKNSFCLSRKENGGRDFYCSKQKICNAKKIMHRYWIFAYVLMCLLDKKLRKKRKKGGAFTFFLQQTKTRWPEGHRSFSDELDENRLFSAVFYFFYGSFYLFVFRFIYMGYLG